MRASASSCTASHWPSSYFTSADSCSSAIYRFAFRRSRSGFGEGHQRVALKLDVDEDVLGLSVAQALSGTESTRCNFARSACRRQTSQRSSALRVQADCRSARRLWHPRCSSWFNGSCVCMCAAPSFVRFFLVHSQFSDGAARFGSSAFQELRSAVFSKVSNEAVRNVGASTFLHLHQLDLNFHLSRQTGALSRTIDRGTRGINFLMSAMLFNIAPTILEIGLVAGVLVCPFSLACSLARWFADSSRLTISMPITLASLSERSQRIRRSRSASLRGARNSART